MDFEDPTAVYGEPPPAYYGDAFALPAPPPPEQDVTGLPVPAPQSTLDAAQYLPIPPPPDRLNYLVDTHDAAHPPGPIALQALPFIVDPSHQPQPVERQLLGAVEHPGAGAPGPLPPSFQAPPPPDALPSLAEPGAAPAPDALSGVDTTKPLGELAPAYAAQLTPEQHYQQTAKQYADDPYKIPDLAEQQRYLNDLALRDPIKAQDLELAHEYERRTAQSAARAKAERENYDREVANLKDRTEARAKIQKETDAIMAEAQRIADTKIDPSGGLGTGQRIAGVLGAIFGGLVQGRTGSARNAGMDAFVDTINRGIDAQKADLANRRGALDFKRSALGEAYARTGDMFLAEESVRQASYQHAINLIDADAQNWDARGTQAMARAKTRAQLVAGQAKSLQDAQYKRQEEAIKAREQQRKEIETAATIQHQKATTALGYAQLNSAKEDRKAAKEARLDERAQKRADDEAERVRQFSISSPRPTLALDDKGQPVVGPDGKPVTLPARFMNKGDKPWLIGSPERTAQMAAKVVSASEIADMIDEVLDIRDKVGGESSIWNSDAKQRLKVLQSRLALVRKNGTQGMSSDKDFENLSASIGADDLASFRSRAAGLKEARERTVSELNSEMRTANYDGPAVTFANKYAGATNTPEDDKRKALMKPVSVDEAIKQGLDKIATDRGYPIDINDPADQALYQQTVASAQASDGLAGQADSIAQLGRSAARGDAPSLATLHGIADNAGSAKLRELAKSEIDALTPKATPRGPRSTAVDIPDELRLR